MNSIRLPKNVKREDLINNGFYQIFEGNNVGIHFWVSKNTFAHSCNFTITPLFHIYNKDSGQNRRIIEVSNGRQTVLLSPQSKAFMSLGLFRDAVFDEGPFLFQGAQGHLNKLNTWMAPRFPRANEVENLGWQPQEFFAFADGAYYDGRFKKPT